jgi:transcription elongation GreA/GreB family factor
MGHKVGDEIAVKTPSGNLALKIVSMR